MLTGETPPDMANCLDLLGVIHRLLADYAHAEPLLALALKVRVWAAFTASPGLALSQKLRSIWSADFAASFCA